MTKAKKKRTKVYQGEDAASTTPIVRRYTAVERSALGQWWHDKKRIMKPVGIGVAGVIVFVWLVSELVRSVL